MTALECKMKECTKSIRIKKLGLCQMHETRQRHYGDPNYKSQRKSFLPLEIPGGEVVCNYQKAKKILTIVSNIEKMIMCGYIHDWDSFNIQVENQIGDIRYSKNWFYTKYIKPILETKKSFTVYYPYAEDISKIVDEIIEKGKVVNSSGLRLLDLERFGIKHENSEFSFTDTVNDIVKKCSELKLDLDKDEDYEICYKLKIHYNRYKKLTDKD